MQEIYQLSVKIAGYLGCVAIGALVSWYLTKQHYEKIVDEEVKSIREVQERKFNDAVNAYNSYHTETVEEDYEQYNTFDTSHPKDDTFAKPYLIPMETFDDADPAFEKVSLEYYTEDKCLVENDEIVEPDESVGIENLERFDKRMDLVVMYIRNEKIGVDYEVTKIIAKWSE